MRRRRPARRRSGGWRGRRCSWGAGPAAGPSGAARGSAAAFRVCAQAAVRSDDGSCCCPAVFGAGVRPRCASASDGLRPRSWRRRWAMHTDDAAHPATRLLRGDRCVEAPASSPTARPFRWHVAAVGVHDGVVLHQPQRVRVLLRVELAGLEASSTWFHAERAPATNIVKSTPKAKKIHKAVSFSSVSCALSTAS